MMFVKQQIAYPRESQVVASLERHCITITPVTVTTPLSGPTISRYLEETKTVVESPNWSSTAAYQCTQ